MAPGYHRLEEEPDTASKVAAGAEVWYFEDMLRMLIALILTAGLPAVTCAGEAAAPDDRKDDPKAAALLAAHNDARAAAGVPPLRWSPELAAGARAWTAELARDPECRIRHSDTRLGENLYACIGACKASKTGLRAAVAGWAEEGRWYDAATGACAAPAGESCGHYTQVIWCDSRELGCAWAECGAGFVVVCRYDPAGNWRGRSPLDCSAPGALAP